MTRGLLMHAAQPTAAPSTASTSAEAPAAAVQTPSTAAAQAPDAHAEPTTPTSATAAAAAAVAMAQAGPSLFDRLGGETLLLDAVDVLYRKVLKDPSLDKFFGGVNMFALKHHQTHFLTLAFGGKSAYSGKSLASTHAHMVQKQGLNTSHFDTMMSHLAETLRYLQVEPDLVQEVLSVMGQYRSVFEAPTQTA